MFRCFRIVVHRLERRDHLIVPGGVLPPDAPTEILKPRFKNVETPKAELSGGDDCALREPPFANEKNDLFLSGVPLSKSTNLLLADLMDKISRLEPQIFGDRTRFHGLDPDPHGRLVCSQGNRLPVVSRQTEGNRQTDDHNPAGFPGTVIFPKLEDAKKNRAMLQSPRAAVRFLSFPLEILQHVTVIEKLFPVRSRNRVFF